MIRDAARALVVVLALLIVLAEMTENQSAPMRADQTDF